MTFADDLVDQGRRVGAAREPGSQRGCEGGGGASARRLFPIISEQQSRELAYLVLQDLEARGIGLVRNRAAA